VVGQASHPALPREGTLVGGKYKVVGVLGEGGMGVVYEALHVRIGQRVAIKMLHPHMLAQPELLGRFEREARAAGQLRSPHAVRVIDVDATAEGLPFMVMELLEGRDIADDLHVRGQLPIDEAVECVLQACEAMAEAHALGIVHRDLKPSNLFLAREGSRVVVKVLDFGISKMAAKDVEVQVTSTLATMGTPLYMSPEQIRSAKNVDARSDVWSLGVILFELLTGRAPFVGTAMAVSAAIVADPPPSPRELRPDVPEALEQVVLRALTKSPDARWQDVQSMSAALAPFAGARVSIAGGQVVSATRGRQVSSPSMFNAPTLSASAASRPATTPLPANTPEPTSNVSPLAHTEAAPVATPPPNITAGTWSNGAKLARASRTRFAVVAGGAGVAIVVALAAWGMRTRSSAPPPPAASAASVVDPVPSTTPAASAETAPPPAGSAAATMATTTAAATTDQPSASTSAPPPSALPTVRRSPAGHGGSPAAAAAAPPPTTPPATAKPTPTTAPATSSNPIRL